MIDINQEDDEKDHEHSWGGGRGQWDEQVVKVAASAKVGVRE